MTAEVLSQPTSSGDYQESRFDARSKCTWVLFRPPEEDDWVSAFGQADYGGNAVSVDWPRHRAFVIAKGQGYMIDTKRRELIYRTNEDLLRAVTSVTARDLFVAADDVQLYAFGNDGLLWKTGRVSWDGIRNLKADGLLVSGEAWNLEAWAKFTMNVDSQSIDGAPTMF